MNKIVCNIDLGLGLQHVYYFKNDKQISEESIAFSDLVNYLVATCYQDNIYNIHLFGNQKYLEGIIEQISIEEQTKYSTHKILLEVN